MPATDGLQATITIALACCKVGLDTARTPTAGGPRPVSAG